MFILGEIGKHTSPINIAYFCCGVNVLGIIRQFTPRFIVVFTPVRRKCYGHHPGMNTQFYGRVYTTLQHMLDPKFNPMSM